MGLEATHIYIGPTTRWGLVSQSECRIVGKRAGGKLIRVKSGGQFIVNKAQLKKIESNDKQGATNGQNRNR